MINWIVRDRIVITIIALSHVSGTCYGQSEHVEGGGLLYANSLATPENIVGWRMEGPGEVEFENGWMHMSAPDMEMHHVFWCPFLVPANFIAEWEVQNRNPRSGLLIVFFSASGTDGRDIFDASLRERDGVFSQYTNGDIQSYHISYYANSLNKPNRGTMRLRKNPGFHMLAETRSQIPSESEAVHRIRLEKSGSEIRFFVDGVIALQHSDDSGDFGPVLSEGRIGFRQMRSTVFRYRNLRVFAHPEGPV